MEYRHEQERQDLVQDLIAVETGISRLLTQATLGFSTIQVKKDAKVKLAHQTKDVEEQKANILKLDQWLDLDLELLNLINGGLKEAKQTDALAEEDIIRYIEIYERYIREYEEYEIILKSMINQDESSQSLIVKLVAMQKALEETRQLVIVKIKSLRQVLRVMRAPDVMDEDSSQTDRTIDSTSMPEEIFSDQTEVIHREPEKLLLVQEVLEKQSEKTVEENKPSPKIREKLSATIGPQTGKSLMSDPPSVADKSVICQPEVTVTQDVAISCAPPREVEVQTSPPHSTEKEILETIQVRQTISDGGHETIEIACRPVVREQTNKKKMLLVDADYKDDKTLKHSQLNITNSFPQSFETVMVEPDETTTEVVFDVDGTTRIIVKKIRKILVTRQQLLQTQQHAHQILRSEGIPRDHSFSQITLREDKGASSTTKDDGGVLTMQYQTYGGQVISSLPHGEVTVQEFTSRPDMVIQMDKRMKSEEILQLAEGEFPSQVQASSSSVKDNRIVKTRKRVIRRVVIIDGKEHVTEEVIEEPDNIEVTEEQILAPLTSVCINVREQENSVQFAEIDNSTHKDDKPCLPPLKKDDDDKKPEEEFSPPYDKSPRHNMSPRHDPSTSGASHSPPRDDQAPLEDKSETRDKSPSGDGKSDDSNDNKPQKDGDKVSLHKISQERELNRLMEDLLKREEKHGFTQLTKTQTVIRKSQDRETSPIQRYSVQEPSNYQTKLISNGVQHSSFETFSTNVSTVVEKVSRKITRTRKRIIKHIQIIDGKEHMIEEVIEALENIEIIDKEPKISHNVQTEGLKTKRIKIIKHEQIIDGNKHVMEQFVEEPDNEYIPDSTITADINLQISHPSAKTLQIIKEEDVDVPKQEEIMEEKTSKVPHMREITLEITAVTSQERNTSVHDIIKSFISSEKEYAYNTQTPAQITKVKDTETAKQPEIKASKHMVRQAKFDETNIFVTPTVTKDISAEILINTNAQESPAGELQTNKNVLVDDTPKVITTVQEVITPNGCVTITPTKEVSGGENSMKETITTSQLTTTSISKKRTTEGPEQIVHSVQEVTHTTEPHITVSMIHKKPVLTSDDKEVTQSIGGEIKYKKPISSMQKPEPMPEDCATSKSLKKDNRKKDKKKSYTDVTTEPELEPEVKPETPKRGEEHTEISPKDKSYRTISEASDIDTIQIVGVCVTISPETVKTEVHKTISYPVTVLEKDPVQEGSIRISPEPIVEIEIPLKPDNFDTELQTSPTSDFKALIQTTPVEDQAAHTQTVEEVTGKIEMSDTEIQTSRIPSPEKKKQIEITTQVIPQHISTPEEKYAQTSPVEVSEFVKKDEPERPATETKETQTSPEPNMQKDEKSTEKVIETTETDIQAVVLEHVDQETSTTPVKGKRVIEMSIKTPEMPLISTFTQSDTPEPEVIEPVNVPSPKKEDITVDGSQPTSPREEEIPKLDLTTLETTERTQQTTPHEQKIATVLAIIRSDRVQQTTPKEYEDTAICTETTVQTIPREPNDMADPAVVTTDVMQQTTPRQPEVVPVISTELITTDVTQLTTPREPEAIPVITTKVFTTDVTQQTTQREPVQGDKVITTDITQQTTPREPELQVLSIPVITTDVTQQKTLHEPVPEVPALDLEHVKPELILSMDITQQTTPRTPREQTPVLPPLDWERREVTTADNHQQTSPRVYSEDFTSASTDEPYEIHLCAQISVSQSINDFLDSKRSFRERPQSLTADRQKRKRKSNNEVDFPFRTPESLSDLIYTELSQSDTPTTRSDDFSSRDPSSIDEGILGSPLSRKQQIGHKLTNSDVVQRSKSKSPSPSKSIIPQKSKKARLLDAFEKRTESAMERQKSIPDASMTIASLEPSVEKSFNLVINKGLDEVKNALKSNDPVRTEKNIIIVIETISVWLEEVNYNIQGETIACIKLSKKDTERLKSVQRYIKYLKEIIEVTKVNKEIISLIDILMRQVDAVNTLLVRSSVKVKEGEKDQHSSKCKWQSVYDTVEKRKTSHKEVRAKLLPKVDRKLNAIEKRVKRIKSHKLHGEPEDEKASRSLLKDLEIPEALEDDVGTLDDAGGRIASARGVIASGADAHRQFVAAHGTCVVALTKGVEQELLECQSLIEDADRLSMAVLSIDGVPDMVAEYRALFSDVRTRLDLARADVTGDVDSAEQVDTLQWQTDASHQVDTLTSKETYRAELTTAVNETSEAVEALRNALLHQPRDKASSDDLATAAKEMPKSGAIPSQTLELAKHLSELLLTECDATEDEAMLKEVKYLSLRYEDLLTQAKKRELQINNLSRIGEIDDQNIHREVESESGEVGDALNFCELVLGDPDVASIKPDLRYLRTGRDIVERKWRSVRDTVKKRKTSLKEVRRATKLLPKVYTKLNAIEKRVDLIESRKQHVEPEDEKASRSVLKDLEALEDDAGMLDDAGGRIASAREIEQQGEAADTAAAARRSSCRRARLVARVLASGTDAHSQFVAAHGTCVVALAEVDVRLTKVHLSPTPKDQHAAVEELMGVEQELLECQCLIKDADRLSMAVLSIDGVPDMVAEYRALFSDVRTRLDLAWADVTGDVDSAEQVDNLQLQTDVSHQVDTLTSKQTYRAELTTAVNETSEAVEALRNALLHQPRDEACSDDLATAAKENARSGAKPSQTLELAKHLSELLLTEYDATEDESMLKEVESLSLRYEDLLAQAKKRELQINNLRLHGVEARLATPVVLERLTTKVTDEKAKYRDHIHREVESESGEFDDALSLCELVLGDPDVVSIKPDLRNLHTGRDIVERQWRSVCDTVEKCKTSLKEVRRAAELDTKLNAIEKRVERIESYKQRVEPKDEEDSRSVLKDLEALEDDAGKLDDAGGRIANARGIELPGEAADTAAAVRGSSRRRARLVAKVLASCADAHRQFVAAHGTCVVALAEVDVRLTRVLHLSPTSEDQHAAVEELMGVEQELLECQSLVEDADRLSMAVLSIDGVPDMVAEYRALFSDVRTRLDLARADVTGDVDSDVQVDNLQLQTDVSHQVDTLTSKQTYRAELTTAVNETSEGLKVLRNALLYQPRDKASSDDLAIAAKEIAKSGAKLLQTLELAKHLSELLLTKCDATDDEAMLRELEFLSLRYEDLLAQTKKRELQINNLSVVANDDEETMSGLQRGFRFVSKAARASLPFQAVLLLLLGATALAPYAHYDRRTLGLGLELVVRYPDGPPPQ